MSRKNLDLVRAICETWERGDFSSAEWARPDIEWVIADGVSPGTWVGLDGLVAGERDFLRGWQEYRLEIEGYRDLDDGRVLALVHSGGRGKVSGLDLAPISSPGAAVFELRDGLVARLVTYYQRARAFEDLGIASKADL